MRTKTWWHMRDLYARLFLARAASDVEIKAAVVACPHAELRADAEAVLLHPGRRRTYDQLHTMLTSIGHMRAALGLLQTPLWQGQSEFDGHMTDSGSRYDRFIRKQENMLTALHFAELMKAGQASPSASRTTVSPRLVQGAVIAGILLVTAFAGLVDTINGVQPAPVGSRPHASSEAVRSVAPAVPVFNEPAVEQPANGTVRRHTEAAGTSPLEIITQGDHNYVVALYSAESSERILDVFVRGGESVNVDVPEGAYVLKYAVGSTWYGYTHNFGPETSYSRADSLFSFSRGTGYTVTLYRVAGGNLGTRGISAADF